MINPELNAFLADWAAAWAPLPASAGAAERRAHFETVAAATRLPMPQVMWLQYWKQKVYKESKII